MFISHASADREVIEQKIVRLLEASGFSVWYAQKDIRTADEWERSILKGLQECEWVVVAVSDSSSSSNWVRDEVYWAVEDRPERIVPFILDGTDPRNLHIRLARLQAVDLSDQQAPTQLLLVLSR